MNSGIQLHPDVITYWRMKAILSCFIWSVIFSIPLFVYWFWLQTWQWMFYGSIISIAIIVIYDLYFIANGVKRKYLRHGYSLTEDEITIRRGDVWSKSSSIIPMNRIQHVDKEQGLIAKRYNLAELAFHTAGQAHTIPGIKMDKAEELRNQVIKLAKIGDLNAYND
ncbi:PH domain-containing protein (plasmid) [Brevibacillus halotolerans]|nr:PH domain-containing protein [Brevibacillus halotolerans]